MSAPVAAPAEVVYPESDGEPTGETDLHRIWMHRIIARLGRHFAGQRVYVSGNLFIYYLEGNLQRGVCPDAFVVKDCEPRQREVFKTWEEQRTPGFVLETTSAATRREDRVFKLQLYAHLGIAEYFLFDPRAEWLDPPLQAYTLVAGRYQALPGDPFKEGIASAQLGVRFRLADDELVMEEISTGKRVLCAEELLAEMEARLLQVQQQTLASLAEKDAALQAALAELARLRAQKGE